MAHFLEKTAERQTVQIRSMGPFALAQNVGPLKNTRNYTPLPLTKP